MNSYAVREALKNRYKDRYRYAVVEEVGLTTGFSHRRIDMIVLDCFESNKFRVDGFEIKVSTSDLRRELEVPEKHTAFFDLIDYYTLVCPKNVAEPVLDIIPQRWGILIVNENGSTRYKRKPLALKEPLNEFVPRAFFASLMRAVVQRKPNEMELKERYDDGFEAGKRSYERNRSFMESEIKRKYESIEAYERMMSRFRLWNNEDIDKAMNEFEAFRKLEVDMTVKAIDQTLEELMELKNKLDGATGSGTATVSVGEESAEGVASQKVKVLFEK